MSDGEPDFDFHWRTPRRGGPCPVCGDTTMVRQHGTFEPNLSRYVTHADGKVCLFPRGWMYTPHDGTWHWRGGEVNPLTGHRVCPCPCEDDPHGGTHVAGCPIPALKAAFDEAAGDVTPEMVAAQLSDFNANIGGIERRLEAHRDLVVAARAWAEPYAGKVMGPGYYAPEEIALAAAIAAVDEADPPAVWTQEEIDGVKAWAKERADRLRPLVDSEGHTYKPGCALEPGVEAPAEAVKPDIHDAIEAWHQTSDDKDAVPLYAHLGMEPDEYERWVDTSELPEGSPFRDSDHEGGAYTRKPSASGVSAGNEASRG